MINKAVNYMSRSSMSRLLVVIVNYKSAGLVCQSLDKLIPQLDENLDSICIVDNDSQDDSVEVINQYIRENNVEDSVEIIVSKINGGFSCGNNLAIRPSLNNENQTPEFFLLLNPDTLMSENAIEELIGFMYKNPNAGIAGSRLQEPDGTPQCSAFRFHTILSEIESSLRLGLVTRLLSRWKIAPDISDAAVQTDWVAGASMIIRSAVFEDVGLMDEDYFLYFEETDFCLQAKRKGWQCWYVPSSKVIHFVGKSTGIISGNAERSRRPSYWFEARQHYFIKNYGFIYTVVADMCWGVGFAIWRFRRIIQGKPDLDPENMLFDFWENSIFFRFFKGSS
jgi:GT2 family glycosyltransferase